MFSYVGVHPLVYLCIVYWNFPSLHCIHIFLQVMKAPQTNVSFHVHLYCRKHGCWIASNEYIGLNVDCMSQTAEVHMHSPYCTSWTTLKWSTTSYKVHLKPWTLKQGPHTIQKAIPLQHSWDHCLTTHARQMTSTILTTTNMAHHCFHFSRSARTFESTARSSSWTKW